MLSIEDLARQLRDAATVQSRSAVIGAADAESGIIARVLEFGSIAGEPPWPRPGPRTTLALDPDTGAQVVVSLRLPHGVIRLQRPQMLQVLLDSLRGSAGWLDAQRIEPDLDRNLGRAGEEIAAQLRGALAGISGRVAGSIVSQLDSRS